MFNTMLGGFPSSICASKCLFFESDTSNFADGFNFSDLIGNH
ncbi:hypothetical protein C4K11_4018 [Pseudomonas chlororaphis subsp. aureofaciens]|nr:hypothetical protein C4K11_4018 [Pseudomonas chlororaphis subsp. aureofaciens]